MKILALDAALGFFSVALDLDGSLSAERSERHDALETGLERVARLLAGADQELGALDRIAVGVGPGSFTGIRIAMSFAKALAYGAHVPLVGVSSYDVLTPPDLPRPCVAVVSGRPGVICARLVERDGATTVACGSIDEVFRRFLAGRPAGPGITMIANTEDVLSDVGERHEIVYRSISPEIGNPAAAIARLAASQVPSGSPHALVPDYGELPAVTVPKAGTVSARVRVS